MKEKVFGILKELSGSDKVTMKSKLQEDLGLDSLQMVMLLVVLEENFHILLDESDMNPFDIITVRQVVDLVEKYVGGEKNEKNEEEG